MAILGKDPDARKRKEIAERLRRGDDVDISPSGEIVDPEDPQANPGKMLKAPEGKLAS